MTEASIVSRHRDHYNARGPNTIRSLGKCFTISGESPNRRVEKMDMMAGLALNDLSFTTAEHDTAKAAFIGADDKFNYDKYYMELTGGLNDARMGIVHQIFASLDKSGCGSVACSNLRVNYNVASHPRVISGHLSEDEAFLEFLACFPDSKNDGTISYDEFCDYYAAVSMLVADDNHFHQLMKQAWNC